MSSNKRDPQDKAFDILTNGGVIPRDALWTPEARTSPTEGPIQLEDLALWPRVVLDPKSSLSTTEARGEGQEASGP